MSNGVSRLSLVQVLAISLAGGTGGAAGYMTVVPPRPDPFTGSQATDLRADIVRDHMLIRREWKLDLRDVEQTIRADMPPAPTRRRIEALEKAVARLMSERGYEWAPGADGFAYLESAP